MIENECYGEIYFKENPVRWSEKAFRSSYFASLKPIFSNHPEIRRGYGKKALDVGCGIGFGVRILLEFGYDAYGLDISQSAIEQAKLSFSSGKFFVHDIHNPLSFREKFDFVQSIDVIEHLENPEKAIKNMYYLLKNEGFMLLTTPNKYSLYTILFDYDKTHINVKSAKEWVAILSKFKWKEMKIYYRQYVPLSYKLLKKFIFFELPYLGNKLVLLLRKG